MDAIFRVQHAVFVEEEGYMLKRHDRRLFDRFDTLPAEDEKRTVSCVSWR